MMGTTWTTTRSATRSTHGWGRRTTPAAIPTPSLAAACLIPTLGVGGHCLPKDGILLWWRALERGLDTSRSLILEARRINDESPGGVVALAERRWGALRGRAVALLGAAYRFNSEDTRNSPTLAFAQLLLAAGCRIMIHDPYVKPGDQNVAAGGLRVCSPMTFRKPWPARTDRSLHRSPGLHPHRRRSRSRPLRIRSDRRLQSSSGCGGTTAPPLRRALGVAAWYACRLVDAVTAGFNRGRAWGGQRGSRAARLSECSYAMTLFERVEFGDVQRLAATCGTGCRIADSGPVEPLSHTSGFTSGSFAGPCRLIGSRHSTAVGESRGTDDSQDSGCRPASPERRERSADGR